VPFSPTSRTIYRKAKQFYWAGSSVEQEGGQEASQGESQGEGQGEGMAFFQRRYSEQDLRERIIGPSGLRLRALRFVGERVWQNSPKEVFEHIPFAAGVAFGPLQPLLARLLQTAPVNRWQTIKKPLCAFIVLEKPE
jgi:hypothetical protein